MLLWLLTSLILSLQCHQHAFYRSFGVVTPQRFTLYPLALNRRESSSSVVIEAQQTIDNLNELYVKQDLNAIRSLLLSEYRSRGLKYYVKLYGGMQKNIFNIGLSSILGVFSSSAESAILLDVLTKQYKTVPSDTFNTIMRHILMVQKDKELGEQLFDRFVLDLKVISPSTRTINMMLEYARDCNSPELFSKYYRLFSAFQVAKDSATYTTAVRSAANLAQLSTIWNETRNDTILNPILFRCYLETLGALGEHGLCLYLALSAAAEQNRSASFSVFVSSSTGDSLLTALLSSDYNVTNNNANQTVAHDLSLFENKSGGSKVHEIDLLTAASALPQLGTLDQLRYCIYLLRNDSSTGRALQCSMKGYSAVFGCLHRTLRTLLQPSSSQQALTSDLLSLRKEAWSYLKASQMSLKHSKNEGGKAVKEWQVINGRVVDAILRCFVQDPKGAKSFWLNELFPLLTSLRKADLMTKQSFDESVQRGLEVMIFIAGFHYKADFALEVAKTIKAHGKFVSFDLSFKQILWKSYLNGKKLKRQQLGYANIASLQDFLFKGLETSLEIELGVLDQRLEEGDGEKKKNGISRIRIQFK